MKTTRINEFKKDLQQKPRHKPREEEHTIQCACIRWFRFAYPNLRYNLFAVPNAGQRSPRLGKWYKNEGLLPGVADLILLKSNRFYGALLIEMKRPTKSSKQSDAQKEWGDYISNCGYKYVICRSLNEFIHEVTEYIRDE